VEHSRGHTDQAIQRMRAAHAGLAGDVPDPDLAAVVAQLGRTLAVQQHAEEASPVLEEALELAEHLRLPDVYSHALSSKAILLLNGDRLDEAGTLLRRALEVALENGLAAAAMRAYNNLSVVLESQDRYADMIANIHQQLELARRVGDRYWELMALTGLASPLFSTGRWTEARAVVHEARQAEVLASLESVSVELLGLVPALVHAGDVGEARLLLESVSPAASSEDWQTRARYFQALAEIARAEGRPDEALAATEEVLAARAGLGLGLANDMVKHALVEALEATLSLGDLERTEELLDIIRSALPGQVSPWLQAQVARLSARASAAAGEHEAVEPRFDAAEAGLRDLGASFDLAVALTEHAEWLVELGRRAQALPLRAAAREIFDRLQAQPWLERLSLLAEEESVSA
jgi:tetratricopeptide (TPR) repeat protein